MLQYLLILLLLHRLLHQLLHQLLLGLLGLRTEEATVEPPPPSRPHLNHALYGVHISLPIALFEQVEEPISYVFGVTSNKKDKIDL
jgi:hypothetical protein